MKLTNKDLRNFGLVLAVVILLLWLLFRPALAWQWLAGIQFAVILASLVAPLTLKPVHWLLSKFSHTISKVVNPLILAIIFFLVVTPLGVFMRLFGYDPMGLKGTAENGSYRNTAEQHKSEHFDRPF